MRKFKLLLILLALTQFVFSQEKLELKTFSKKELLQDFNLTVNSLKEAHPGLYWYTSYLEFDSICKTQKAKIKDGLNGLEFYNILAPIISATREGHSKISLSNEIDDFMNKKGRYPPIFLKFFENEPYVINDIENEKSTGYILSKINGHPFEEIKNKIFNTLTSDGFNQTKKYKRIDGQDFSYYYSDVFEQTDFYIIELVNPKTNKKKEYNTPAVSNNVLSNMWKNLKTKYSLEEEAPVSLNFQKKKKTAILTFNTFREDKYLDFHKITDSLFRQVFLQNPENIIIDLRKNGGGNEGYEDYVFSYLTNKPYNKYKYVQAAAFSYSFYQYSNKKTKEQYSKLENGLKEEHFINSDGRILRKPEILIPEKPKEDSYKGNLYILISGHTYSGGSELASLIKGHTNALFIGEETGGGFYGNTSGFSIKLILPNSKLIVKIPLLKFVVDVSNDEIPFGRGVIPDYIIKPKFSDFLKGKDTELEFTEELIKNQ